LIAPHTIAAPGECPAACRWCTLRGLLAVTSGLHTVQPISDLAPSRPARRRVWIRAFAIAAAIVSWHAAAPAQQPLRVGYVNVERIMRESAPALAAQKRLDDQFGSRDATIQELENALRVEQTALERPGAVPEAERARRLREAEFQAQRIARQRRDFQAELDISRTDETNALYNAAVLAIRRVAEEQGMDLVLQDMVYIRPDRDITEKVIERLGKPP